MMLESWRDKSALQRFADDLKQRKLNLKSKIEQNDGRIRDSRGEAFRANDKSDDYLLRQFFAEFTSICQQIFFPNLLVTVQAVASTTEESTTAHTMQIKEETTFAE